MHWLVLLGLLQAFTATAPPFDAGGRDSTGAMIICCDSTCWLPDTSAVTMVAVADGGWRQFVETRICYRGVPQLFDHFTAPAGVYFVRVRTSDVGGVACKWSNKLLRVALGW